MYVCIIAVYTLWIYAIWISRLHGILRIGPFAGIEVHPCELNVRQWLKTNDYSRHRKNADLISFKGRFVEQNIFSNEYNFSVAE